MKKRVAVIATVYNEAKSIIPFVESLLKQSRKPDEIIITDGGSHDKTLEVLSEFIKKGGHQRLMKTFLATGNRSIGRNAAIEAATSDIIAVTDAGCIIEPTWLENIVAPFETQEEVDVVGGWYQPIIHSDFEAAQAMTTVPSLKTINPAIFLPSTRSVAFTKQAWAAVGGFDVRFSHNEDTPFAQSLKRQGFRFVFEPKAVVGWQQQQTLRGVWKQFFRYAVGDAEAMSLTTQYPLLFGLGVLFIASIVLGVTNSVWWLVGGLIAALAYLELPLILHTDRAKKASFLYLVPMTKLTVILATLSGFTYGLVHKGRS